MVTNDNGVPILENSGGQTSGGFLASGRFDQNAGRVATGAGDGPVYLLGGSSLALVILHGYGGYFSGPVAQISLEPQAGEHPGTGKAGDLFVDSSFNL